MRKLMSLLFLLTSGFWLLTPAFPQQVSIQGPVQNIQGQDATLPMMRFDPARTGQTGNQTEWRATDSLNSLTIAPTTGLPAIGSSGSYRVFNLSNTSIGGYSVFASSPMTTTTTLRGVEARVRTTGGTHPADGFLQAGRFDATMDTGTVSLEEAWGVNSTLTANAGTVNAMYGSVGDLAINTGVTISGAINSGVFGGFFQSYVHSGVTFTNTAQDNALAGIILESTGRRKADAAVAAILQGAINQSTAGALAAFKVYDSNTGANFDYGLDLTGYPTTYTTTYNIAEQRFSNGAHVFTGAATTRAALRAEVDAKIAPANVAIGSPYFSTAGKQYLKVANAGADTDWQRVTTSAAD